MRSPWGGGISPAALYGAYGLAYSTGRGALVEYEVNLLASELPVPAK